MARTIVEDAEPQRLRDEATAKFPRTEEAWRALTWLLARNPTIGTAIGFGDNIRVHKQPAHSIAGVHVNGLEGFWARLKLSIRGTHVHVSAKHLPKYLAEFEYRYNMRKAPEFMFQRLLLSF